jgi:dihydroorotate dehydrogenase electron transfer subunit
MSAVATEEAGALQVRGSVLSTQRLGAYHHMALVAPGIAERARPGQFGALAVGGAESGLVLRRAFSIHKVSSRGVYGGTVEIVFAAVGAGTRWLAAQPLHAPVDVVGPLGRAFPLPREQVRATLVGGGYGSAPLFPLAEQLLARGSRVDFVLGAGSADRLFGALDAKRMAATVAITTDDGTTGTRGVVTDVLPDVLRKSRADVVYACGPMPMLRAVTHAAAAHGITAQCAVEESMACGIGVCMTCVLPVVGDDGRTRMVRSCVDGPVFRGDRVRWDAVGTVPPDAVGAPARAGGDR